MLLFLFVVIMYLYLFWCFIWYYICIYISLWHEIKWYGREAIKFWMCARYLPLNCLLSLQYDFFNKKNVILKQTVFKCCKCWEKPRKTNYWEEERNLGKNSNALFCILICTLTYRMWHPCSHNKWFPMKLKSRSELI